MLLKRTALFTTVYPAVLPYLRDWYRSVKEQSDGDFDLCIASDSLTQDEVYSATQEEFQASWYFATAGESPVAIRINALRSISERYDAIVLVDSDDILLPSRVERSKDFIENSDMNACALDLVDEYANPLYTTIGRNFAHKGSELLNFLLYRNVFGFSNMTFRTTLLCQLLKTSSKSPALDWNFATRAAAMGAHISFDTVSGMLYRQHRSNIARILPPFHKDTLIQSTLIVLEHYQDILNMLPSDTRKRIEVRQSDVVLFHKKITMDVEICEAYLEAINEIHEERYWWSFVAHPQLKEIWV